MAAHAYCVLREKAYWRVMGNPGRWRPIDRCLDVPMASRRVVVFTFVRSDAWAPVAITMINAASGWDWCAWRGSRTSTKRDRR